MSRLRSRPSVPTINSVAKAAGVSVSTVSRVVRDHTDVGETTREKVQRVIGELGYRPSPIARALVSGHSPTFGLLVSDIANPFYPQLAKSIERASHKLGYALVICNTEDDPRETTQYVEMLRALGARGVIQASGGPDDEALLQQLGDWQRVVFTNRRPRVEVTNYVVSDNEAGAVALTEHLVEQGHRRIGFVAGPDYASNSRERLSGFHAVMNRLGTSGQTIVFEGSFSLESGRRAVRQWMSLGSLPTAIIGVNDLVAVGALEELFECGIRVPESVAVAGFDDIELADSKLLALTSVRQHIDQMGSETVRLLARLLRSDRPIGPIHKIISPDLAIRRSTMHRVVGER